MPKKKEVKKDKTKVAPVDKMVRRQDHKVKSEDGETWRSQSVSQQQAEN